MKKIISTAALSLLSALLLSGCAGGPAAAPEPSTTAAKTAAPMPTPNPAQEASLRAEFKKIDPALSTPRTVDDARLECRLIMHGSPEAAQISSAKRLLRGTKVAAGAATDDAAKKIVEIIRTNGFCKTAA